MATAMIGATAFIGNGDILERSSVIVEQDKIVKVTTADGALPVDTDVIDITGHMLLPGFVDCHLHLLVDGSPNPLAAVQQFSWPMITLIAANHARETLMAGVTSARDMGGTANVDIALRDAVRSGVIAGPRLLVSGRQICMTGGQGWQFGREADGPNEVRKAAREQIKAGCDIVKLMATGGIMTPGAEPGAAELTEEELRAGVEEAHKAGRKAAAHAQGTVGILNALRAGVDSIEHGFFLSEECITLMKDNGVPFVPTLGPGDMLEHAALAGVPEFIIEKSRRVRKPHLESLAMAKEAGVTIGMGADCGTPLNRHGQNLRELVGLVENGFTPTEALCIGTLNSARILGLEDVLGSIEVGKLADLVVVRGDPLSDIALLTDSANISVVMQGGKVFKSHNLFK
jgi:imidazolonepropionase-like amidohydrolase